MTSAARAVTGATSVAASSAGSRIAGAAVILVGGFLASRVVGLARDVVITARFGTSADLDVYVAAFRIPDTIFTLVAGGALGSALIPVFAEYRAAREAGALSRLAGEVLNFVLVAGVLLAALLMIFTPQLVPLLGAGFAPAEQARLAVLVRVMLLQPIFFGLGEVVTRFLQVHQHFLYPALAPLIYNLAIIAGALVLGASMGTLGLALGVVAGSLLYFLVQVPAAARLGFRAATTLNVRDPGLRQIVTLMLPRLVSQGATQFSNIVTTRLASFLSTGSLAALQYGWLLMMLPLGTFAMSLAGAAFPTLAEQAALGDLPTMASTVRRSLSSILFLMVPSAIGLVVVGLPLVQTLYQRGQFTEHSSQLTAIALAVYAFGLPAHGALEILTRSFFALQDTRTPVAVGVAQMVSNIVLATLLVGPMQHVGIALALTLTTAGEALALAALLHRRLPGTFSGSFWRSVGATLFSGAALAVVTLLVVTATRPAGLRPLVQTVAAAGAGTVAYAAAAFLLRSPDLQRIVDMARSKLGR